MIEVYNDKCDTGAVQDGLGSHGASHSWYSLHVTCSYIEIIHAHILKSFHVTDLLDVTEEAIFCLSFTIPIFFFFTLFVHHLLTIAYISLSSYNIVRYLADGNDYELDLWHNLCFCQPGLSHDLAETT